VLILDTLLIGGLKFIFGKIAEAVDAELNDESGLREELLAAQMRVELGEMSEAEFGELERAILARIREIRRRTMGDVPSPRDVKIAGVEATVWSDESEEDDRQSGPSRR
jgi:gas vesicle protein GvpG